MIDVELRSHLVTLYGEPQRHYHNLSHILHCVREMNDYLDSDFHQVVDTLVLEYAIWFHDAVYDPRATHGQNEKNSSEMAFGYLFSRFRSVEPDLAGRVARMIQETAWHTTSTETDPTIDVFFDIDLAILGASSQDYEAYARNIRKEYSWVPLDVYEENRTKILESFLNLKSIYRTEHFRNKYENLARSNIRWEIDNLGTLV